MGCNSCSSGGGCVPAGCKSNGSCMTGGCGKLDVMDWFSGMEMPSGYQAFNIIEVRFKGARKQFYRNTNNSYLEAGELVVVETASSGYDIGHVTMTGELVRMQLKKQGVKEDSEEIKKVLRKANEKDVERWKKSKELENDLLHKSRKLAIELKLVMKISDVDVQGDGTKSTFYYTAEGRVDFRELIKKYAEQFKLRIEMRQVGMRQEASRLGGIGSCGRELCCSTWLTDFKTVSTSAARYQNLALNTLKLAGQCGKLKCCLNYELDTYMDALRDFPKDVDSVETEKGRARLQKTDIFKKLMWFSYHHDDNWVPVGVKRVAEILDMNKKGQKPADLLSDEEKQLLEEKVAEPVLDYMNVVGQDSLTRLDEKDRRNKNKNRRNKNKNRNPNQGQQQGQAQGQPNQQAQQQKPQQQRPPQQGGNNNNNRRDNNQPRDNNNQSKFKKP